MAPLHQATAPPPSTPATVEHEGFVQRLLSPLHWLGPALSALFNVPGDMQSASQSSSTPRPTATAHPLRPRPPPIASALSSSPAFPPMSSDASFIDLTTDDDHDDGVGKPSRQDEEEEEDEEESTLFYEEFESLGPEEEEKMEEQRALADHEWRNGPLLVAIQEAIVPWKHTPGSQEATMSSRGHTPALLYEMVLAFALTHREAGPDLRDDDCTATHHRGE